MTIDHRFAAAGSWVLVFWGMGHAIVIDILPLVFGIDTLDVNGFLDDARQPAMGKSCVQPPAELSSVWGSDTVCIMGDNSWARFLAVRSTSNARLNNKWILRFSMALPSKLHILVTPSGYSPSWSASA